ncbi:hypothetical protein OEZ86_002283 [Tetradesmus obliquus]|nr:hypothetical protein OEZ86_002283 [Tetradesmus obliquus]
MLKATGMMKHGSLVLLAVAACVLLCYVQLASAACCMTGQPTWKNTGFNLEGIPTCSDGPCSDGDSDYTKKGAVQSSNPKACCDREDTNSFFYNPQPKQGKWPGIPGFPMSYDGTSQKCDASVAVFRCRLGGAEKAAPKRFSFRRFI